MGQCYNHLNASEREEISRDIALGCSCRAIDRQLRRGLRALGDNQPARLSAVMN